MPLKRSVKVLLIILFVLLIDQSLKIWVKTHMEYNESFEIFGLKWAMIYFVENPGMAFGIELGGNYGKLALSLFRIFAVGFLIYYLRHLIRSNIGFGLLTSFSLILAGAVGNIIDSAFYGMIFSESPFHGGLAEMFPEGGGYAGFLHGKVVDMLYFPIIEGRFPDGMPFWGGKQFLFFKPIFNIADLSITLGVINILLFQRSFLSSSKNTASAEEMKPSAYPPGQPAGKDQLISSPVETTSGNKYQSGQDTTKQPGTEEGDQHV